MASRDWYCEEVLSGKTKIQTIWEDERVLAFHHPYPRFKVHAVVIPKQHVTSILDLKAVDGLLLTSMVLAVQNVTAALGIDKTGFYVRTNAGAPGVTPHMHWHIIPLEPKPADAK